MTDRSLRPIPLLVTLALGVSSLGAQDTSTVRDSVARRLPAIEILGSVLPALAPGVGSPVPARISIIAGAERAGASPLLSELLSSEAGTSLYDDLGSRYKQTLVLRGFTASPVVGLPQGVSVFVDGVPMNEPDAGQVNFDLLPLAHVRRIEVLHGTASLLGPNSLAGAVNLVTRRGGGATGAELAVTVGSYARRAVEASADGTVRGWSWYVGGALDREGGWRQLTGARRGDILLNVGRFGARAGLGIQLNLASARAETAGSLPLSVFASRPDSNLSAGDFENLRQSNAALHGYAAFAGGRVSFAAYARAHDAERFNVNQQDDPDVRGFSRNETVGGTLDWRASRRTDAGTLGLAIGMGTQAARSRIALHAERIDPGLTTDVESPITKLDAFALGDWRVGRVTLSGGVRHDAVRVPFRNLLDPSRDTTSRYVRLSPRGGVRVELGAHASVYASVGRSFRAPAVIELACADPEEPCPLPFALGDDPPLAPVVATTVETGASWSRGMLRVDGAAFVTQVRDDIFLLPYEAEDEPAGSTIDGYFANLARTRRAGVEIDARMALPRGHALRATWSRTRATFESEAEIFSVREAAGEENEVVPGSRMPLVPEQTATLELYASLGGGLGASAEARYTGRCWLRGDEANVTTPLAGGWRVDARLRHVRGPWAIDLAVRNALGSADPTFGTFNINQAAGDVLERFVTPMHPRSVELTVRRAFGADRE